MATNPMQRKARVSFLLGMLVMLIITGAIIAFLILQLTNMKKAEQELEESYIKVYVLNKDVASGDEITLEDLTATDVVKTNAPTDYITDKTVDTAEEEGNKIIAKISMTEGTIVSNEMINLEGEEVGNDTRKQEFNMFILPTDLQTGDYVDVRLLLPSGTDYIVVSKKKVEIPMISGIDSTDTISIELNEDEINLLSNAIVDAFKVNGAKLYVNKYIEPGLQEASQPTYAVNAEVMALINSNPNIVEEARNALWNRYNADQRNSVINPAVQNEDAQDNLQDNMEESITNSITTRQEYLEGLGTTVTTNSGSSSSNSTSSNTTSN